MIFWGRKKQREDLQAMEAKNASMVVGGIELLKGSGSWLGGGTHGPLAVNVIYNCTRVMSETLAMLPVHLYRRDDKMRTKIEDHPVAKLLKIPNPMQTWFEFSETMVLHLFLRGNFYARINRSLGEPRELQVLPPDSVEVRQVRPMQIEYEHNGKTIPAKDMLHVKFLSYDGVKGFGPIDVLREQVNLAKGQQSTCANTIKNSLKLGGIIWSDLKGQAFLEWKKRLIESATGGKEGSTLILEHGGKFEPLTMKPTDVEFLATSKFTNAQLAGACRVPSHMINDLDRATFNNIEHLDIQFWKHSCQPLAIRVEQAIGRRLLGDDGYLEYNVEYNPDGLLRGDVKTRYESHIHAISYGIRTPNEVRALENLPPRGDGLGDEYYFPANLLPAKRMNELAGENADGSQAA